MMMHKIFYRLLISLSLLAVLASCQSNKSAVGGYFDLDTDVKIDFIVDSDINPDEQGAASPLFIRMYQLKTPKLMKKADFIDLYEKDKAVLGSDLVSVRKLKRFTPGENRTEQFVLDKKAAYIALYGEFLNFSESRFKLVIPVVTNNVFKNSVTVRVSGNQLLLN